MFEQLFPDPGKSTWKSNFSTKASNGETEVATEFRAPKNARLDIYLIKSGSQHETNLQHAKQYNLRATKL